MSEPLTKLERWIKISGLLIIAGLVVELISLRWDHPTSFLVFIFTGGVLIGIGILAYLYSIVSVRN
jgi:hypothetical protein